LVRHAYLIAAGAYLDDPYQAWSNKVDRLVLLAAPNRGFQPNRLPRPHRVALSLVGSVTRLTVRDLQAGSPYITDLRLRWMQFFDRYEKHHASDRSDDAPRPAEAPGVIQVLGDTDTLVTRQDSLDVEQPDNAAHIYVPQCTHTDLPQLTGVANADERWRLLNWAIFGPITPTPASKPKPKSVAFLLHGIRAGKDGWVRDLGRDLRKKNKQLQVYGPSYGYFSALSFALPMTRSKNLRGFLDAYSYHYARHRGGDEQFFFVGHSNGTYILGQALRSVPALRFARVYLAGSVLPTDYPWLSVLNNHQVDSVRNNRADRDLAVAWLCSALRGLGMRDIGTGGFDGFLQSDERLDECYYYRGGHGAALQRNYLDDITAYLNDNDPRTPRLGRHDPKLVRLVSRLAPPLTLTGAATGVALSALWVARNPTPRRLAAAGGVLAAAATMAKTV
jgi:hypothetical protein